VSRALCDEAIWVSGGDRGRSAAWPLVRPGPGLPAAGLPLPPPRLLRRAACQGGTPLAPGVARWPRLGGRLNDVARRPGRGSSGGAPLSPAAILRPCGAPRGVPLPPSAFPGRYPAAVRGRGRGVAGPSPAVRFPGRYLRPCGGAGSVLRTAERSCDAGGPSRTAERCCEMAGAWQFGRRTAFSGRYPAAVRGAAWCPSPAVRLPRPLSCGRAGCRVMSLSRRPLSPAATLRPCGGAVTLSLSAVRSPRPLSCGRAGAPVRCCGFLSRRPLSGHNLRSYGGDDRRGKPL
jgi:hypothetical protein